MKNGVFLSHESNDDAYDRVVRIQPGSWVDEALCVSIHAAASSSAPAWAGYAIRTITLQRTVIVTTQEESFRAASVQQGGNDNDSMASEYVSAEEACQLFGISRASLRRVLHRASAAPAPTTPDDQTPRAA